MADLHRQISDAPFLGQNVFITNRQRNCGKVMFLHVSVILFTGGSLSQHAPQVTWPGGLCLGGLCLGVSLTETEIPQRPPYSFREILLNKRLALPSPTLSWCSLLGNSGSATEKYNVFRNAQYASTPSHSLCYVQTE